MDCMQDVEDGTELVGFTTTRSNPFKKVWDAALLLHSMELLHFRVCRPAAQKPHVLSVCELCCSLQFEICILSIAYARTLCRLIPLLLLFRWTLQIVLKNHLMMASPWRSGPQA